MKISMKRGRLLVMCALRVEVHHERISITGLKEDVS